MTKKFFLHVQYYDGILFIHKYYTGGFVELKDQLESLIAGELPEMSFFFQSNPFAGIESGRYVKLV